MSPDSPASNFTLTTETQRSQSNYFFLENRFLSDSPEISLSSVLLTFNFLKFFRDFSDGSFRLAILILVIRICFAFRLPARSRFGGGRDFVLRIWLQLRCVVSSMSQASPMSGR